MKKREIHYKDELNDDFASNNIKHVPLPKNFNYYPKNKLWRGFANFLYFCIGVPIVTLILKLYLHQKFVNKKLLKSVDGPYFIYSNHSNGFADAVTPAISNWKKKAYIIANSDCMNIKCMQNIIKMVGGFPLPDTLEESKKFKRRMDEIIKNKDVITIYPEAHIWPYYTDIRPFTDNAFKYPVKYNLPIFTITHCYKKRKIGKRPKMISYVDGPFYPEKDLNIKENSKYLRDICYDNMKSRVKESSIYSYVTYIKDKSNEE